MTATEILALVAQGLALLPNLIQIGVDVTERIQNLMNLSSAAANGTVTQDQINTVRAQLDADLATFNADLPPQT